MSAKNTTGVGLMSRRGLVYALLASNVLSLLLYGLRVIVAHDYQYGFLLWNLVLAWLPLLLAWKLTSRQGPTNWRDRQNIVLGILWLAFLPNSFYLLSDLVHLKSTGQVSLLYDSVMFFSYIFNGFVAGFMSLYLVHRNLQARLKRIDAHVLVGAIIVLCSFAIYLGRYLRWNTWDIFLSPAGLLFDISDRLINPVAHPQAFTTTLAFALLIGSMYAVVWQLAGVLRDD